MEIAARFLGTRPRTRWEVERRLRRAGAADTVIAATLERLMAGAYIDDLAFARWWIEQRDRHAPRGRRLVEAELRQHGIGREVLEALHLQDLPELGSDAEGLPASEADRARVALARHLRGRPMPDDRKSIERLGMFLVRRGFDPDTVRSTLRAAGHGPGADEGNDD